MLKSPKPGKGGCKGISMVTVGFTYGSHNSRPSVVLRTFRKLSRLGFTTSIGTLRLRRWRGEWLCVLGISQVVQPVVYLGLWNSAVSPGSHGFILQSQDLICDSDNSTGQLTLSKGHYRPFYHFINTGLVVPYFRLVRLCSWNSFRLTTSPSSFILLEF